MLIKADNRCVSQRPRSLWQGCSPGLIAGALTALRSQPEVTLTFNNKPGHDCTILNQLKVS